MTEAPDLKGPAADTSVSAAPLLCAPESSSLKQKSKPVKQPKEKKEKKAKKAWVPTREQIEMVAELSELGWPSTKLAEALSVSQPDFASVLAAPGPLREAYDRGVNRHKTYREDKAKWRPMPEDIRQVQELAAKGYGWIEIAGKLKITRAAITARAADTPQLQEAFEQGQAEYRANLIDDLDGLIKDRDKDLKYVAASLIFKLKAHCDLNDKPVPVQKVEVAGTVDHKHQHQLKAPPTVPINQIQDFAAKEMARAQKLSEEKLKKVELKVVADDVIDIAAEEVVDG